MNTLQSSILVLFTCLLSSNLTHAWFFEEEHKTRTLDGSLRCYQCNSSEESYEGPDSLAVCSLRNWKHANMTEKRNMIMQCPRRKSAFCHLVVREDTDTDKGTIRGCSGPNYTSGMPAHIGCFSMVDPHGAFVNRVCLCDTNLCNLSNRIVFDRFVYCLALMWWLKYFI